jgi:hypothetical protein
VSDKQIAGKLEEREDAATRNNKLHPNYCYNNFAINSFCGCVFVLFIRRHIAWSL